MSRHWGKIDEVGFLFGMRLMYLMHRWMGRWPFRIVLYPVVTAYWLRSAVARRASIDYIRRLRAAGVEPGRMASLRQFCAFAECMLDKLLAWSGSFDFSSCRCEGYELFESLRDAGQGGMIITGHIGNFEVSRALALLRQDGRRMHVLTYTRNAARFNQLMTELNPDSQLNLVSVADLSPATVMFLAARVAEGDFVVITGDRVPVSEGTPVVRAPFLGENALFPAGPWIIASALKVPVLLMWAVAEKGGYRIRFERFRDRISLPRRTRGTAIVPIVADYAARFEAEVRHAPLQWFNFFDFWAPPEGVRYDVYE